MEHTQTPRRRRFERDRSGLRRRQYRDASLNTRTPETVSYIKTADRARLRVQTYGSTNNPTLLFIHGWACCIEYWNPQINALSDRYHVVAYDQRGHGESSRGQRRVSANALADDLSEVLTQAVPDQDKAVLVGHSMGGITLQAWAHRHPDQVGERAAAMMLANTTWGGIAKGTRVLPLLNDRIPGPLWLGKTIFGAPIPLPGDAFAASLVRSRVLDRRSATKEHAQFTLDMTRSCKPTARARTALMLADLALESAGAEAISVPTTVSAGRYDKLLPPSMSDLIADVLERNGTLDRRLVLDTGHAGNVEAAYDFNAEVERLAQTHLLGGMVAEEAVG